MYEYVNEIYYNEDNSNHIGYAIVAHDGDDRLIYSGRILK